MDGQLFQGMTKEMLQESWGEPDDKDEERLRSKLKQTWKYNQAGVNRYGVRVYLENDVVVGWKDDLSSPRGRSERAMMAKAVSGRSDGFWTSLGKAIVRSTVPMATRTLEEAIKRGALGSSTKLSPTLQPDQDAETRLGGSLKDTIGYSLTSESDQDARAWLDLGNKSYRGEGVPQDDAEAVKWYRLAANQGNADAQGKLREWASGKTKRS